MIQRDFNLCKGLPVTGFIVLNSKCWQKPYDHVIMDYVIAVDVFDTCCKSELLAVLLSNSEEFPITDAGFVAAGAEWPDDSRQDREEPEEQRKEFALKFNSVAHVEPRDRNWVLLNCPFVTM